MKPGFLRTARLILAILTILGSAGATIGAAWYAALRTSAQRREEAIALANGTAAGLAAAYAEQIGRHVLALDQSLDLIAREWETDPRGFNLETIRARSLILNGISRDMILIDENGTIRQASVPEAVGRNAADLDIFREAAAHAADKPKLLLGGAAVNAIMRQWHIDAARPLRNADGSFAGILNTDYRVSAILAVFEAARPPGNGYAALIDLTGGRLRAVSGPTMVSPDGSIADTPMFAAADARETGFWTGPSATDAVVRIHAFRRVPGTTMAVAAALDERDVLAPVDTWRTQSLAFAGSVTALSLFVAAVLLVVLRSSRRQANIAREHRSVLAAANAQAEVARAEADAVARRLQATFLSVSDGVAIFDPHLNLVEWNGYFAERSGVNASLIRTGMPMEDVLRTQAREGYFGDNGDVEGEVDRRAALMRAGNFGTSVSLRAKGRVVEMRCRPLPEGGFVALYTDVTDARSSRQALRDARERLDRRDAARTRLLGAIAHEIRERAAPLFRPFLASSRPTPGIRQDLDQSAARIDRTAAALEELAAATADIPSIQAGTTVLRPGLTAVAPLLRDIVEAAGPAAREQGQTVHLTVHPLAPAELIADPVRLRQIAAFLLAEAMRHAAPGPLWLMAEPGEQGADGTDSALRVIVRGFGTPFPETADGVFPGFDAIAAPDVDGPGGKSSGSAGRDGTGRDGAGQNGTGQNGTGHNGTGLWLAIARHLTVSFGGRLNHETWLTADGRAGNDFVLDLPPSLLPGRTGRAPGFAPGGMPGEIPGEARAAERPLPRTRVLMIGPLTGLRAAAATMLRRDGHMVELSETRDAAIRLLGVVPFDIVFFDTDLPGMTVEAAATAIRGVGGPARAVPLAALAPSHSETEARTWQMAGVDDILTSPPGFAALIAAIDRDVWRARRSGQRFGSMVAWDEDSEEGIPILAPERLHELRATATADELRHMVEECVADLGRRLPALRRALMAGAGAAITAQAQTMAGIASGYGLSVLEARLRAIQAAVRERRLYTISGAPEVVEEDIARAAAALRRAVRRAVLTPPEPAQAEPVQPEPVQAEPVQPEPADAPGPAPGAP